VTDEDHEAVQELLSGYVLHALDEADQSRADELLARHVPHCAECLATLEGFSSVAGDLALLAPPRQPPRTLEARLRRELRGVRGSRWAAVVAAGVAVTVVAGLVTWNAHLTGRVSAAEDRQLRTTEVLTAVSHPQSQVVPLLGERPVVTDTIDGAAVQLAAAFIPGRSALYLFGSMPVPHAHHLYQVWLHQNGRFASVGTFVPEDGVVLVRIEADPTGYDGLLITEEPTPGSRQPSDRHVGTAAL
jgi:predicted anti-sigma-YlaC factor YlaD